MKIIVDADACPGISIIENVSKKYKVNLFLYCDNTHNLTSDYAKVIICDKGFQSVDTKIMNVIEKDDIVISQDYGVATIALSKKAKALHPKGKIYTSQNIDTLLLERHIHTKLRNKKSIKGPKKRTSDDDLKLEKNLEFLLNQILKKDI